MYELIMCVDVMLRIVIWSYCRYVKERIQARPGFRLVLVEFQYTNVCLWFIPPSFRGQEEDGVWWDKIHNVSNIRTKVIKTAGLCAVLLK
jgi:hypothetical protein